MCSSSPAPRALQDAGPTASCRVSLSPAAGCTRGPVRAPCDASAGLGEGGALSAPLACATVRTCSSDVAAPTAGPAASQAAPGAGSPPGGSAPAAAPTGACCPALPEPAGRGAAAADTECASEVAAAAGAIAAATPAEAGAHEERGSAQGTASDRRLSASSGAAPMDGSLVHGACGPAGSGQGLTESGQCPSSRAPCPGDKCTSTATPGRGAAECGHGPSGGERSPASCPPGRGAAAAAPAASLPAAAFYRRWRMSEARHGLLHAAGALEHLARAAIRPCTSAGEELLCVHAVMKDAMVVSTDQARSDLPSEDAGGWCTPGHAWEPACRPPAPTSCASLALTANRARDAPGGALCAAAAGRGAAPASGGRAGGLQRVWPPGRRVPLGRRPCAGRRAAVHACPRRPPC